MKVGSRIIMNEYSSYSGMYGVIKKINDLETGIIVELDSGLTFATVPQVVNEVKYENYKLKIA